MPIRACKHCGTKFDANVTWQIYCPGKFCRQKAAYFRRKKERRAAKAKS